MERGVLGEEGRCKALRLSKTNHGAGQRAVAAGAFSSPQFVFISGLAHAATLRINRHKLRHAMNAFMTMPASRELENS